LAPPHSRRVLDFLKSYTITTAHVLNQTIKSPGIEANHLPGQALTRNLTRRPSIAIGDFDLYLAQVLNRNRNSPKCAELTQNSFILTKDIELNSMICHQHLSGRSIRHRHS